MIRRATTPGKDTPAAAYAARLRTVVGAVLFLAAAVLPQWTLAEAPPKAWKPLPWHLIDYYHRFPDTGTFRAIEIDLTLKGQVPKETYLYVSPLWGRFGNKGFYFGFLSDMYDPKAKTNIGRGIIFSRWGLGSHEDARPTRDAQSFIGKKATSGEGDFVSIRKPFHWTEGRYTFLMRARHPDRSSTGTWVDLLILEHASGKWIDAGGLRFRKQELRLRNQLASFVEIFAKRGRSRRHFPKSLPNLTVSLSPPLVNGTYEPISNRVRFGKKVPRLVEVEDDGLDFHIKLGGLPVPRAPAAKTAPQ